ncbi:MAG TPA: S41 family peptidase [Herpetosiphonaceae bacterium]
MSTTTSKLEADARAAIIDSILSQLHEHYVFPEVAAEIETALRARLDNHEYHGMEALDDLCVKLTEDLQAISRDKHLRVFYRAEPIALTPEPTPWSEEFIQTISLNNFGFHKIERLPGNVGYLDLRFFYPPTLAGDTAVAAMNFLAHTSALIVDLRQNGGGDPWLVALLTSYLFDFRPVHLNNLYWRRDGTTQQFWTLPYVPGRRYGDKPVYVLTSSHTFSGGEEFVYNLKHLKRATIIGEVTRGGAHPGRVLPIHEHVDIFIPSGRAINPISGTNWEGSGVMPDIELPQEQALQKAYELALQAVFEYIGEQPSGAHKALLTEVRRVLDEMETARRALAEIEAAQQAMDGMEAPPPVEDIAQTASGDARANE